MSQPNDLQDAIQSAVQTVVGDLRRRLKEAGSTATADEDERLKGQTILLVDEEASKPTPPPEPVPPVPPAPPAETLPTPEDRMALESALGLQAEPAAPGPDLSDLETLAQGEMSKSQEAAPPRPPEPPKLPPPAPIAAADAPRPPAALSPAPAPPPIAAAGPLRVLIFCWTVLIGVLTILDRALPSGLKTRKTLLGRIGIALTGAAILALVGMTLMRRFGHRV